MWKHQVEASKEIQYWRPNACNGLFGDNIVRPAGLVGVLQPHK